MSSNHITVYWSEKHAERDASWGMLGEIPVQIQRGSRTHIYQEVRPGRKIGIVGHPFLGATIDLSAFSQAYREEGHKDSFLKRINGEFLILDLDESQKELRVINSRFASPIFWYVYEPGYFLGSTSYFQLCRQLKKDGRFTLAPQAFYESLTFKRLFGDKALDTRSRYLRPASVLSIYPHGIAQKHYWQIAYRANNQSLADNAQTLGHLIRESIRKKCSDNRRYGLFLSGGLDTRTLLAHFDTPPHCFTLTYSQNREYRVAHQLAQWKNAPHTWIQMKEGHYRQHHTESIQTAASLYIPNAFFLGHHNEVKNHVDVLFAGYGFDYFFQGMYLPAQTYRLLGRDLLYKRMANLPDNLPDYFLNNISYRVKGQALSTLLKKGRKRDLEAYLQHQIVKLLEEAKEAAEDPYNIWEYLSLGFLSRHYTYVGQLCLMAISEFRTLSYENDIYDFYLSCPPKHRFDAAVFRRALRNINPSFYKHISANHGYPAGFSSFQRSLLNVKERMLKKLRGKNQPSAFNIKYERTWFPSDHILRNELLDYMQMVQDSPYLDALGLFDMDRLSRIVQQWEQGEIEGDQLFMMILSVDQFLRMLDAE